jgi:hypothetical protein
VDDLALMDDFAEMLARATEDPSSGFVASMADLVARERAADGIRRGGASLEAAVRLIEHRGEDARRSRVLVAACVMLAVALGSGTIVWRVARDRDDPSSQLLTNPALTVSWESVTKDASGLGATSSFDAVASLDDAVVLVGATQQGNEWHRAIWRTTDAMSWTRASIPEGLGEVHAVAANGSTMVAIGSDDNGSFVWKSVDDGRTWAVADEGPGIFGTPAPQMGRPSVEGLLWHAGYWIATGGGSDGYEGLWVSKDAANWTQVQLDGTAGSVAVVPAADGLFGYWVNLIWTSNDAKQWTSVVRVDVPDDYYLGVVAPGATVAFGVNGVGPHGQPTPLLRSADGGAHWSEDVSFLDAFPDAQISTVTRIGDLWVAAGMSGDQHPDAFVSADAKAWLRMPESVRGAPGAGLSLFAQIGKRTLILGTTPVIFEGSAPELDRYFVATTS